MLKKHCLNILLKHVSFISVVLNMLYYFLKKCLKRQTLPQNKKISQFILGISSNI